MLDAKTSNQLTKSWTCQAATLGLRKGTKKYAEAQISFLSGALVILQLEGLITHDHLGIVHFLVACGRIDEVLNLKGE